MTAVLYLFFSGSHRSGKNRRKLERKLASLKEGSPHEEAALILALHALVRAVVDLRGSCGELGGALLAEGRGQREAEHTQVTYILTGNKPIIVLKEKSYIEVGH